MSSSKRSGRLIGLLILIQLAVGLLVSFVLLRPPTTPGFLENAAESSYQLGVAVLLSLVTGALSVGIAITAWPVFRRHSSSMALWFLSLSTVTFALVAVADVPVMSMLSLSRAYAGTVAPDEELFQALAAMVRSSRRWMQLTSALVGECMILLHFSILYRFALIPRPLSVFGLASVLLKIAGISMPFFGHGVPLAMVLPMVLSYLALSLWLMAKGFEERPHPSGPEGHNDAGFGPV